METQRLMTTAPNLNDVDCSLVVFWFLLCRPVTSSSVLVSRWWGNQVGSAAAVSLGPCIHLGMRHQVFFFFFKRVNGNCLLRTPRGSVILKEVSRLGNWLTQPSPALGGLTLPGGGCLSCHWAALVFYPISTWINRFRTSSAARLRICQNSPGNGWFTSSRGKREAVSKRPAHSDSHFLSAKSSGLGCLKRYWCLQAGCQFAQWDRWFWFSL